MPLKPAQIGRLENGQMLENIILHRTGGDLDDTWSTVAIQNSSCHVPRHRADRIPSLRPKSGAMDATGSERASDHRDITDR